MKIEQVLPLHEEDLKIPTLSLACLFFLLPIKQFDTKFQLVRTKPEISFNKIYEAILICSYVKKMKPNIILCIYINY